MDLDEQALGPGCQGRFGQGSDELPAPRGVARVGDDREPGEFPEQGDGRDVEGVPGQGLEGPDAPFAEDDLAVPFGQNIFGRLEPFLDRSRKPSL